MIFWFRTRYQKVKTWYARAERILIPTTLLGGFVLDYVTFTTIQMNTALIMLCIHFTLAGVSIAFNSFYDAGNISHRLKFVRLFTPLVIQFTFGALLGASFVFYWFSASFSVSWPFIGLIAVLMVSNEVFRKQFLKPVVQLGVYFFITLSFFSIAVPYLFNDISASLFLLSGIASMAFAGAYSYGLSSVSAELKEQRRSLALAIIGVFVIINALYMANIIPPIPLALREAGVYHYIQRAGSSYIVRTEQETFWQTLVPRRTIHIRTGEPVYAYTSIFAPTDLSTRIYHHWQWYDEARNEWVSRDRLSFAIIGGRAQGYRGYSLKRALDAGAWRVSVETERGQTLGRIRFDVVLTHEAPILTEEKK